MSDALERLKNRQRPIVPARSVSIESESVDTSTSGHLESINTDSLISKNLELENADSLISENQETSNLIKPPKMLTTKQTTIRLEAKLLERVTKLCAKENLSREVLFEALFEHYEQDSEAWASILSEAKRKAENRLMIANRKRAKTMMKRFNG